MDAETPSFVPDYYNTSFNPRNIVLTYESAFSLETTITFEQLQEWVENKLKYGIIYGTRIGASGVAMLILLLVTKNKKSPIFIFNIFSLLFMILHSGIYLKYLKSDYTSITYSFTYFPQLVKKSDIYTTGAANMLEVLLIFCVELSLVFQVYTIFKTTNTKYFGQMWITISLGLGLATIGLFFAAAIKNIMAVYRNPNSSGDPKLYNVAVICLASSINCMTLLLCFKLAHAIKSRRFLGLKQFDSFHILFIMTSQSLIIPSILYILSYALPSHDGTQSLQAIATLLIVLSLPFSSMWAGSSSSKSSLNTMNPNFSSGVNYDQHSFQSQGINSALHSRRDKKRKVGFEDCDESIFNGDSATDNFSYMNHAVETPVNTNLNPALASSVLVENLDAEYQELMIQQTASNSESNDGNVLYTKTIMKKEKQ